MAYLFNGPSLQTLIPSVFFGALIGAAYKSIANTDNSPIYILISKAVAEFALYRIAASKVDDSRSRALVYAVTNLIVTGAALALFRKKQLIGSCGAALFISLMAFEFFCKLHSVSKFSDASSAAVIHTRIAQV